MFLIAKFADQLLQPLNWVTALLVFSMLLRRTQSACQAWLVPAALMLLLGTGWMPLPDAGLRWLESQYPEIPPHADLRQFNGVVVLGGALDSAYVSAAHPQPSLNSAGERMAGAVALWREQPQLEILFTGGEGDLFADGPSEADRARNFFDSQGVRPDAVRYEGRSRNTLENASFSARTQNVDPKKRWLLLTSAWHMPRSMAIFESAGWNVTAYPVDYRTGTSTPWHRFSISTGAEHWWLLLHELFGMASLRLLAISRQ